MVTQHDPMIASSVSTKNKYYESKKRKAKKHILEEKDPN